MSLPPNHQHCPTCKEAKKIREFRDQRGVVRKVCNSCRARKQWRDLQARQRESSDNEITRALRNWR